MDEELRTSREIILVNHIRAYRIAFLVMMLVWFGVGVYADIQHPDAFLGLAVRALPLLGYIVYELRLNMVYSSAIPPAIPDTRSRRMSPLRRVLLFTLVGAIVLTVPELLQKSPSVSRIVSQASLVTGIALYLGLSRRHT